MDRDNSLEKKHFDISAEKEYYKARMKYVEFYPGDKTNLDVLREKKNLKL